MCPTLHQHHNMSCWVHICSPAVPVASIAIIPVLIMLHDDNRYDGGRGKDTRIGHSSRSRSRSQHKGRGQEVKGRRSSSTTSSPLSRGKRQESHDVQREKDRRPSSGSSSTSTRSTSVIPVGGLTQSCCRTITLRLSGTAESSGAGEFQVYSMRCIIHKC